MGALGALNSDRRAPSLNKILGKNFVKEISEEEFKDIKEFLPEGQKEEKYLEQNFNSIQFQAALKSLDSAVYSDQCVSIFKSFNIFDQKIFDECKDRKVISC